MGRSILRKAWRALSHWVVLIVLIAALALDLSILAHRSRERAVTSTVGQLTADLLGLPHPAPGPPGIPPRPIAVRLHADGTAGLHDWRSGYEGELLVVNVMAPFRDLRRQGWLHPTRDVNELRMSIYGTEPPEVTLTEEQKRLALRAAVDDQVDRGWLPDLTDRQFDRLVADASVLLLNRPIYLGYLHNALTLTLAALLLVSLVRTPRRVYIERRTARRTRRGQCPTCAYDLAGITNTTCPECGSTAT